MIDGNVLDQDLDFRDPAGASRLPRERTLLPRGPKSFRIEKAGTGVRAIITDWDHESVEEVGSGAISYLVYWAENVDMTTAAGVANGFARATLLAPAIPAPGKDGGEAAAFFADPKYLTGYFYCVGVDGLGNRSDATDPIHVQSGTGGTIPPDVEHFQASESGEQHNGTTISAVAYSFQIPSNGSGIESVQFMYRNYPNLGELSEGESVRVLVGIDGTQTGKLKLPIGRRIGSGTIAITSSDGKSITGVGTSFLTMAAAGDQLEFFGARSRIASVTDNTHLALTTAWTSPPIAQTISNATNATPIVVSTTATHPFTSGQSVVVTGVLGNTAANGTWTITVISSTSFSLNTSVGNGAYTSGGVASLSVGDWQTIATVTIYAVSEGRNGARRDDVTSAPSQTVDLDGDLSTPIAPSLTATVMGNMIRLEITPPSGTQLSRILLYRATGAGVTFDKSTCLVIHAFSIDNSNASKSLQWDDSDFTTYEREQGQTFSYFVSAVNVRDQESAASSRVEASCRLDSSQDNDPATTARVNLKNLLYNAFISGTAANNVLANDASQDANLFTDGANAPGRPYGAASGQANGTGRYQGYTRWESTSTGGAALAVHQNASEVRFPAPGVGNIVYLYQEIEAWDSAKGAAFIKLQKDGIAVFSGFLRHNGVQPSAGTFHIFLEHYNNNAFSNYAYRRYRDSSSTFQQIGDSLQITASTIASTWRRYYAVFRLDSSRGTSKQMRLTFAYNGGTGGDVVLTMPMLNAGEELSFWTGDMGDTYVSNPIPGANPPTELGDGFGKRIDYLDIP